MKITTNLLKQLIREVLEEGRTRPWELRYTEEERKYLDRLTSNYFEYGKNIIDLFNEIGRWFKSLTADGGPLEGGRIADYPILQKAEAIQLSLRNQDGSWKKPQAVAYNDYRNSGGRGGERDVDTDDVRKTLNKLHNNFKKIEKEVGRIHDPEAGTKRDYAIRQSRGEISKFEKAAAQGFPKQDPEKQRGR